VLGIINLISLSPEQPDLTSGLDAPIPEDIVAKASVATVVKNEKKGESDSARQRICTLIFELALFVIDGVYVLTSF